MKDITEIIITAIEEERMERELSLQAIAMDLKLNQQTLYRIVNRQRRLGMDTFQAIMAARPQWWDLINGSALEDPDGAPDRSVDRDNNREA